MRTEHCPSLLKLHFNPGFNNVTSPHQGCTTLLQWKLKDHHEQEQREGAWCLCVAPSVLFLLQWLKDMPLINTCLGTKAIKQHQHQKWLHGRPFGLLYISKIFDGLLKKHQIQSQDQKQSENSHVVFLLNLPFCLAAKQSFNTELETQAHQPGRDERLTRKKQRESGTASGMLASWSSSHLTAVNWVGLSVLMLNSDIPPDYSVSMQCWQRKTNNTEETMQHTNNNPKSFKGKDFKVSKVLTWEQKLSVLNYN